MPQLDGLAFVQVGANDGVRVDPIHRFIDIHRWSGVMVEPLPRHFAALASRHGTNNRLRLIQAAVDASDGYRLMYDISADSERLPDWANGLASFSRGRVVESAKRLCLPESAVVACKVETITWTKLWTQLGPRRCDVLVIDTEGFDIALLRVANLQKHRPRIILFEHELVESEDRFNFYKELVSIGYEIATDAGDTVAWTRE